MVWALNTNFLSSINFGFALGRMGFEPELNHNLFIFQLLIKSKDVLKARTCVEKELS